MSTKSVSAMIFTLLLSSTSAVADCSVSGTGGQKFIHIEKKWSIIERSDLPDDDKKLWEEHHAGLCPGIAVVDLDGQGWSYALALLRKSRSGTVEKLVLFKRTGSHLRQIQIRGAFKVVSPFVVWKAAPGIFFDQGTGVRVRIAHDSIIYEKMESTSTQFYASRSGIRSLLVSN